MSLDGVSFDETDLLLFRVDDLRLKADALRYSILPKLHYLLHHTFKQVAEIYGVDPLEDSHIAESPNFRTQRENELAHSYQAATMGLTGKRAKDKWHGFRRKDGQPVQILPFVYDYGLSELGLGLRLQNYWLKGLSDDSFVKLLDFHLEFEAQINTLCFRSAILPLFVDSEECGSFATLAQQYQWRKEHRAFDNDFSSCSVSLPTTRDTLESLATSFCIFYPVYDSYIRIAKGEPVRLERLVQKLTAWSRTVSPMAFPIPQTTADEELLALARIRAEQRVSVIGALRWRVFQRDGWKCVACGRRPTPDNDVILHVDHIQPRSRGGRDDLDNLQTLCIDCNLGKGNRDNTDLRTL